MSWGGPAQVSDPSPGPQVQPLGRIAKPGLFPQQGVDDQGEEGGGNGSNAVGNLASNDALIAPSAIGKVVEYHEALENDENPPQRQ